MHRKAVIWLIATISAVSLLIWAYFTWQYLRAGFALQIDLSGPGAPSSSEYRVSFPESRLVGHVIVTALAALGIFLMPVRQGWSARILWAGTALLIVISLVDIHFYGLIGKPSSSTALLLMVLCATVPLVLPRKR